MDGVQARLTRLEALALADDTTACPPYPSVSDGTVHGSGVAPGAIRVVECGAGFALFGSSGTILCNDGAR
jgi:hypothetical protein